MTRKLGARQRAELEAWEERRLPLGEFEARARAPMSEREREDFRELVAWFKRRYTTAGARLAYVRRGVQRLRRRLRTG